jgi:uncharacterized protein (DUF342 family)
MSGAAWLPDFAQRPDGTYLTVPPGVSLPAPERLEAQLLERGIINYDLDAINQALQRRSGTPEKVGPPFQSFVWDKAPFIQLKIGPEQATVRIDPALYQKELTVTAEDVCYLLRRQGVIYGLDPNAVRNYLHQKNFSRELVAARARPPVPGSDARVELKVREENAKPVIQEDGTIDYHNVNTILQVEEGQVLAVKIPATPGEPGISVLGQPLPAIPGRDADLPAGPNTALSPDGTRLLAATGGFLLRQNRLIGVGEMFVVQGDVDFNTGNIKYRGDIVVSGSVLPDFTVESTNGSIHIQGMVEAATLLAPAGSIEIKGGVVGKKKAVLRAGKNITLQYVQESELECGERLTAAKYILHSTVAAKDVSLTHPDAFLAGGQATVFNSLTTATLGTDTGVQTTIRLVDPEDSKLEQKRREMDRILADLDQQIQPLQRSLKMHNEMVEKLKSMTPEIKKKINDTASRYKTLVQKREFIQERVRKIEELRNQPKKCEGWVEVTGTIHPQVEIMMYRKKFRTDQSRYKLRLTYSDGEIVY